MSAIQTAPTTNAKMIIPFVNAVQAVFSTMVGVKATPGRPYIKSAATPNHDVSAIVGFSGEVTGSVVVSFAEAAAIKLVASFAGSEMAVGSPDFADAIGELGNMIAGNAKKDLGGNASIGVPTVIIGRSHVLARLSDVPCVVIPCTTPVGDFAVEVSIKQVAPKS